MILLKVREPSIKYCSSLKHARNDQEKSLVNQIEQLEKHENNLRIGDELKKLRQQLESLREIKLKGQMVHSRAQWLHSGEKPSHFFVTLNANISLIKPQEKFALRMVNHNKPN